LAGALLTPRFASEVAANICELRNRSTRMRRASKSFGLDAGGLDDRGPFFVLGMNSRVECSRRAPDRRGAELGQPLIDFRGVQRRYEIAGKFCSELGRHAGRPQQSPPDLR